MRLTDWSIRKPESLVSPDGTCLQRRDVAGFAYKYKHDYNRVYGNESSGAIEQESVDNGWREDAIV